MARQQYRDRTDTPCSHAGGVVYRLAATGPEYLLVRARKDPTSWVLPKGHIEAGESARDAALREVLEEAGVRGKVVAPLGRLQMDGNCSEMFLMRYVADGSEARERPRAWLELKAALQVAAFPESRDLLTSAHAIVQRQS